MILEKSAEASHSNKEGIIEQLVADYRSLNAEPDKALTYKVIRKNHWA